MRAVASHCSAAALIALLGCSEESSFLALPELGEAKSALLAFEFGAETVMVLTPPGGRVEVTFQEGDRRSLHLVALSASVEELGLAAGRLSADQIATLAETCALVQLGKSFASSISGSTAEPWVPAPLPTRISEQVLPSARCSGCLEFAPPTFIALERDEPPSWAAWLENGMAVVGIAETGLFMLSSEGVEAELTGCPAPYFATHPLGDDSFWVGGSDRIDRIRVDAASSSCSVLETFPVPAPPDGNAIVSIIPIPESASGEIYALDERGWIFRVGTGTISTYAYLPGSADPQLPRGGLASLGGAVYVAHDSPEIFELRPEGPVLHSAVPSSGADARVDALGVVEGFGLFAGTNRGEVFELVGNAEWRSILELSSTQWVSTILSFRGLPIIVAGGELHRVRRGRTVCPPVALYAPPRAFDSSVLARDDALFFPRLHYTGENAPRKVAWRFPAEP